MSMPTFTIRQLLESGVHFGHHTRRWNPKMTPYIFGVRNNIHIINLEETVPLLSQALAAVRETAASGGRILFVGTKKSCSEIIAEAAKSCGQYYVNHRWLGGMMTNFSTVSNSIKRLKELDGKLNSEEINALSKKEVLKMTRDRDKLNNSLGGIKDMGGLPDMLFVLDTIKDSIAINEAKTLNIPVVAVLDTNSNPDGIDYPIPGNDDALRAVTLYCNLISESIIDGLQAEMLKQEKDFDLKEKLPEEIDNTVSKNQTKDNNSHKFNEKTLNLSKTKEDEELPTNVDKGGNKEKRVEINKTNNINKESKIENDSSLKNEANSADDTNLADKDDKLEKKSSNKETSKKMKKNDENSVSKKNTKQAKSNKPDIADENTSKITTKSKKSQSK